MTEWLSRLPLRRRIALACAAVNVVGVLALLGFALRGLA
jgi:hypothetical protein